LDARLVPFSPMREPSISIVVNYRSGEPFLRLVNLGLFNDVGRSIIATGDAKSLKLTYPEASSPDRSQIDL
jgi:hypothetical protein